MLPNYNLSLVSGGKPFLPNFALPSLNNKNISILTNDQKNFISIYNNQLKFYSIETNNCIKTIKFNNNDKLFNILDNENIVSILPIDITNINTNFNTTNTNSNSNSNITQKNDKDLENVIQSKITAITENGNIIILNYKGKLNDQNLSFHKINNFNSNEKIVKVFNTGLNNNDNNNNNFKILTISNNSDDKKTKNNQSRENIMNYKLYDLNIIANEKIDFEINEIWSLNNVILFNWSNLESTIIALYQDSTVDKSNDYDKKIIVLDLSNLTELFKFNLNQLFTDNNNFNNTTNNNASSINKFVSSLAVDNLNKNIALGFASGVISLINIDSITTKKTESLNTKDLNVRYLKWHIDSVLSLSFNNDSTYLISGGWEKVLSFWQLSTNLQQFLPRLNGIILDIKLLNEKFYSVTLQLMENDSNSDYQILLINSIDLSTKLAINGPLPIFNTKLPNTQLPISTQNTSSNTINNLKKYNKKLIKSKKFDFTTCIELNPINKQLYIPNGNKLQIFDFYKNEQVNLQYLTNGINNFMGKVRDELNLKDPQITDLKLTVNNNWLITYEIEYPPNDLLSSNDISYSLKFWFKENENTNNWTLKTKILNPHGIGVPIINMCCNSVNNNGNNLITADNCGGLKYWEFNNLEQNWCLKKIFIPSFNNISHHVSIAWSRDNSLIFHGFDDKLQLINFDNFQKINDDIFNNGGNGDFTMDSPIQAIKLVSDSNLIVATTSSLNVIDLLLGKFVNSFDLYPYVNNNYKDGHLNRLIACDEKNGKIAIVINENLINYHNKQNKNNDNKNDKLNCQSNILIFNSNLTQQLGSFVHPNYISWIGWNFDTDFIFMDIASRFGIVSTTMTTEMADEINKEGILDGLTNKSIVANNETNDNVEYGDITNTNNNNNNNNYLDQLRKLANEKQMMTISSSNNNNNNNIEEDDMEVDIINGEHGQKLITMNSFTNMFDNMQNVSMETLFDNVIKILN